MIDFLVIGGGIAGISVAARLSHLGSVIVLEAESGLGYHTSGRSAALFEESYGKPTTTRTFFSRQRASTSLGVIGASFRWPNPMSGQTASGPRSPVRIRITSFSGST